jgi:hypothetical protein
MNWKRSMSRHLLFALLGGMAATAIYLGLLYTKALHGFAVKALGSAIDLAYSLDPIYHARSHRYLEELAANVFLYAFWIFVALIGIDLLRPLKRKLAR